MKEILIKKLFKILPLCVKGFMKDLNEETLCFEVKIDDTFDFVEQNIICNGFEKYVMEDDRVVFKGINWDIEMFALLINQIIAEHFGVKNKIYLKDWFEATQRICEAFTDEGYQEHEFITPDILRNYVKKK